MHRIFLFVLLILNFSCNTEHRVLIEEPQPMKISINKDVEFQTNFINYCNSNIIYHNEYHNGSLIFFDLDKKTEVHRIEFARRALSRREKVFVEEYNC